MARKIFLIIAIIVGLNYDLFFYPNDVQDIVKEYRGATIISYNQGKKLVFEHKNERYQWLNNRTLKKGKEEIGYYPFLYFRKIQKSVLDSICKEE